MLNMSDRKLPSIIDYKVSHTKADRQATGSSNSADPAYQSDCFWFREEDFLRFSPGGHIGHVTQTSTFIPLYHGAHMKFGFNRPTSVCNSL